MGDECVEGETCFHGSPCATVVVPGATTPSKNNEATLDEGSTETTKPAMTDGGAGGILADVESHLHRDTADETSSAVNETPPTVANPNTVQDVNEVSSADDSPPANDAQAATEAVNESPATINHPISAANHNEPIEPETESDEPTQARKDPCNLCGDTGELDWSLEVEYDGNDVSCGEFGWLFVSDNIANGSDQCNTYRDQYADQCCLLKPAGTPGCNLCDAGIDKPWHDIKEDASVKINGHDISCIDLQSNVRSRFEPANDKCTEIKLEHFDNCCFEKCSLCGDDDSHVDMKATAQFKGEEMPCHQIDSDVFLDEGISAESSRCEMSQSFYAETCCVKTVHYPEANTGDKAGLPCNICTRNGYDFVMTSKTEVNYENKDTTCVDVYQSLYTKYDLSSEHCIKAQEELFDQCCEAALLLGNDGGVDSPGEENQQSGPIEINDADSGFTAWCE